MPMGEQGRLAPQQLAASTAQDSTVPMLGDAAQQKKLPRKVRAQENVLQRLFLCLRLSTAPGSWVNPRAGQESYGHNLTGPFLLSRERACSVAGGLVPQNNNLKSLTG